MELLYTPSRKKYITTKKNNKKGCPFCEQPKENNDTKNYILKRYKHCFVILNLHPYNAGHLLVIPYDHKAELYEISSEKQHDFVEAISSACKILKDALGAEGLNVGMNFGKPSGGSIPDHLHCHIIPRWSGDTNFLAVSADTKTIAFNLNDIYHKLMPKFS